ncbi:MAG: carboxypeptidase-like regulatory domain-containing protein, partial [Bacteroidia bacterium]
MIRKFSIYIILFMLFSGVSYAQNQTIIKGIISDFKTGEPLPFVTVMFDGTTFGVNTDFEGQYVIEVDSSTKYNK